MTPDDFAHWAKIEEELDSCLSDWFTFNQCIGMANLSPLLFRVALETMLGIHGVEGTREIMHEIFEETIKDEEV